MFAQPSPTQDDYVACARYLSRMGASHLAATHDFAGGPSRDLHIYVQSTVFPDASDVAVREHLGDCLQSYVAAAKLYGLGVHFDCRLLPCQGGPWVKDADRADFLRRFPPEVLSDCGTYQGKVLCFGHPRVREYYAEVIKLFFDKFPEIDSFHYLTMDAEGEFCDPQSCPRCRGLSKFDQRDRLARFLGEHLPKARPGILIMDTAHQWDRAQFGVPELLRRQRELPPSVGLCLAATGDAATFERQAHDDLRQARAVTAKAGQKVVGRDALHRFEDSLLDVRDVFDYPLGVFAKIRRWNDLGFDGVYDVRGRLATGDLHANSLACRAALLNPTGDARTYCTDLAQRWFGPQAGESVLVAWEYLDRAQALVSNGYSFPSSSPLSEYVNWHFNRATCPVPTNPKFTAALDTQMAPDYGEFEPVDGNGFTYHEGDYPATLATSGDCMTRASLLAAEAESCLSQALSMQLPPAIPDTAAWLNDGATLSPAEFLSRHRVYVANVRYFYGIMGPYMVLKSIRIKCGENVALYVSTAREWLQRYATAARSFASHIETLQNSDLLARPIAERMSPSIFLDRAQQVERLLASDHAHD